MKFLIFGMACAAGIPLVAFASAYSTRLRGGLLTLLILSTAFDSMATINFFSMEFYRGPDRGFEVALTDLIAWGLILGLLMRFRGKLCWVPYNSVWMFLFFGVALASAFWAAEQVFAFFTVFKFIRIYLVFWCVVNCLRVGTPHQYVWAGLVGVAWLIAGMAFKQKYLDGLVRVHGPFAHSNTNPSFLILIIPVVLIWGLCERQFTKGQVLVTLGSVVGMVFVIIATLSRAGVVFAAASLLGALVFANVRARSGRVVATSALVFMCMLTGGIKAWDSLVARFQNAPKESAMAREEFNLSAMMMVRDHPAGIGLNNFSWALTHRPEYHEHFEVMAAEVEMQGGGVVHHVYWLMAAETGYVGLGIFAIILARFAWLAARGAWRCPTLEGLLLGGIFIGFCSLYLIGLLEWTLRITPVFYMFAIISALCVAFSERAHAPDSVLHRVVEQIRQVDGVFKARASSPSEIDAGWADYGDWRTGPRGLSRWRNT